jgi:hypothetical protein
MQKNEYANVYKSFVVIKKKKILCEIKGWTIYLIK